MSSRWFIAIEGKKYGPFTDDRLRDLASGGVLLPIHHLWKQGMIEWVQAGRVHGLYSQSTGNGAPPPQTLTEPLQAPEWYFNNEGAKLGPVTLRELEMLAARGIITRESFLMRTGSYKGWALASQFEELELKLRSKESGRNGRPHKNKPKFAVKSIMGLLGIG